MSSRKSNMRSTFGSSFKLEATLSTEGDLDAMTPTVVKRVRCAADDETVLTEDRPALQRALNTYRYMADPGQTHRMKRLLVEAENAPDASPYLYPEESRSERASPRGGAEHSMRYDCLATE
ncbi:unnamed protein product [Zymoseptoria tritici ST99CH_1A5]|uniref:Uncharacterized protein n=1 Tax=Zymoseptoria tritici ST99CH_1A5 TaxID=1276529 RepID=A0A1Y6LV95_ZYMTR|nr:unnamed protein product [Zymoseptoria tritici ST99CH_1A5]